MHNVPVWEDILKQWVTFYTNCSKPIFPTGSVITNCLCVFYIWIMEPQMAVRLGHLDMNVQARMFVSQKKLTIPRYREKSKFDFNKFDYKIWLLTLETITLGKLNSWVGANFNYLHVSPLLSLPLFLIFLLKQIFKNIFFMLLMFNVNSSNIKI